MPSPAITRRLQGDGIRKCKRPLVRPFAWDRFRGSADLPNDYDLAVLQILEGDTDTYLLVFHQPLLRWPWSSSSRPS